MFKRIIAVIVVLFVQAAVVPDKSHDQSAATNVIQALKEVP